MGRNPSCETNSFSASQEIPAFYGNWRFITATAPLPILATCLAHLILLGLFALIIFGEEYRSLSSSLYSLLHSSVTSFHLCLNILLSSLFSNTLILHSSLNVRNHVSHQYKKTGKIILRFILSWIANWKAKHSTPNDSKHHVLMVLIMAGIAIMGNLKFSKFNSVYFCGDFTIPEQ